MHVAGQTVQSAPWTETHFPQDPASIPKCAEYVKSLPRFLLTGGQAEDQHCCRLLPHPHSPFPSAPQQ